MNGGSPLRTAAGFVAPGVSQEMAYLWGEALWTARDQADREFQKEVRSKSLRFLFGIPSEADEEQ